MKILIVDDSTLNRVFLVRALSKAGHEAIDAENGARAVELFSSESPDLVLMDLMMPVMNGYAATRTIKSLSGEKFTPIIVLTALTDTKSLVKAIEYGADDYLTKPYNIDEIIAKIVSLGRIAKLHETINESRNEILRNKEKLDEDIYVAEHIYKSVLNLNGNVADFINNKSFGSSPFSGEIMLSSHTPSGDVHILMGQFSGHGLSAAIGAIPTSEIFYGLTEKGFSIADIAHELNSRLRTVLPGNMHCKTCFLEIDKNRTAIGIWNSGMPDVVIRSPDDLVKHYPANKRAPGTVADAEFERQLEIIPIAGNEKVYLCNSELFNLLSDMDDEYAFTKYKKIHDAIPFEDVSLDTIISAVSSYSDVDINGSSVSLVEINLDKLLDAWSADEGQTTDQFTAASIWSANICFDASCLKTVNPVPSLLDIIMNIQSPKGHKEKIFTILTELFSNAQEHGLLRLDSSLKSSPAGFTEYYAEREKRLAELDEGQILVSIEHSPKHDGGAFTIVMTDSGQGFDYKKSATSMSDNTGFSGRGLPLIRSICDELSYNEAGNQATAIYSWS